MGKETCTHFSSGSLWKRYRNTVDDKVCCPACQGNMDIFFDEKEESEKSQGNVASNQGIPSEYLEESDSKNILRDSNGGTLWSSPVSGKRAFSSVWPMRGNLTYLS